MRDVLAGRTITDIDMATSATPEQVLGLFEHVAPTGLQHGTVTVITGTGTYEVTTFRKESAYEAFRKPASVEFISDLNEDLRRRDFTMNAMAINEHGELIDPFGGRGDLEQGLIRCVGDADARLQEDALRMLRGIRFAADYGSLRDAIEPSTWTAIIRHRSLLQHIAMERVGAELYKMIKGPHPDKAMQLLLASRLLEYTKDKLPLALDQAPATWSLPLEAGQPEALLERISAASAGGRPVPVLRPGCEASGELFQALRYSRQHSDEVSSIVALHRETTRLILTHANLEEETIRERWTRLILEFGKETSGLWLEMAGEAPQLTGDQASLPSVSLLRRLWSELEISELKQLAVNGGDIMSQSG